MKIIAQALMVASLIFMQPSHAVDSDWAYFGMGSAIQYGCGYAADAVFHLEKKETWKSSLFCGIATSAIVGFTAAQDRSVKQGNSFGYGVLGASHAILVRHGFEF